MTTDEWYHAVERAAARLVQHTYSAQDGTVTLGSTERTDLLAVRREDWDALYALLEGEAQSQDTKPQ